MQPDALDAGVYGGLHTKESIRLLVCYILNNISEPLPANRFCDEMHADGIANYFELVAAVNDLAKKELIKETEFGSGYYVLTKLGRSTIAQLKESIPRDVRRHAYEATVKMLRRIKYQEQTVVKAEKRPNGEYLLSCSVMEGDKEMMTVRLNLPDFETTENAKNYFWDSPETIYAGVIKLLTKEDLHYHEDEIEFIDH